MDTSLGLHDDKKAEHDYLKADPELMAYVTCIGNLVRELRNAQRAVKLLVNHKWVSTVSNLCGKFAKYRKYELGKTREIS